MTNPVPICYCDAPGFGDTVTLVFTRNWTSADGYTTITGAATFTWTRVLLSARAKFPAFPCTDYGSDPASGQTVAKGQFLAVSCANGRMPGWLLFFGAQDPVVKAYTQTYTPPPPPPGYTGPSGPVVTYLDADGEMSAVTCKAASGRPVMAAALAGGVQRNGVFGINSGFQGGTVHTEDTPINVELLRAQQAASGKIPAVGPLYRVTIPADCDLASGQNASGGNLGDRAYVVYNGANCPAADPFNGFTGLYGLDELPGEVHFRAANVADVLLAYGDTLASGLIPGGYVGFAPKDVVLGGPHAMPIANPFPMAGQNFTHHDDALGLDVSVTF